MLRAGVQRSRERGSNTDALRGLRLYSQLEFGLFCLFGFLHLFGLLHLFELFVGRLVATIGSRMLYEPDPRKHLGEHRNYQWVVPVDSIIDSRPDAGDGCRLWYVNSQLMGAWLVPQHLIKAAFPRGVDELPASCLQESSSE